MNVKKTAVRGLIILAIAVAVCMFFSETIVTITTAKVRIMTPRQGKLSQSVALMGKLTFLEKKDVYLQGAGDVMLNVKSVKVAAGYEVEAGDVIFTAEIAEYDKNLSALKTEYASLETQLETLERKGIKLKRSETAWSDAYARATDAKEAALDAHLSLNALLRVEGKQLTADGALPEDAGEALTAAFEAYTQARDLLTAAQKEMTEAERYSIDEDVRSYITEKKALTDKMAAAEENMIEFGALNQRMSSVRAEEDGYITEINVKAGTAFATNAVAYSLCPIDTKPVLRADIEESTINITKGMDVKLSGRNGSEIKSEVVTVGATVDGKQYADIELTKQVLRELGGVYAASLNDVAISAEYKAKNATTLLPSSAVRGSGEDRYVYVVNREYSSFGVTRMKIAKETVTVLAESDGIISVEQDLSYRQIAYMEDRSISEGSSVMEYLD